MESEDELRQLLAGGDRRSLGAANEIVSLIKGTGPLVDALIQLMTDDDPVVSMRAADAFEKASRENPGILREHKSALLRRIAENAQQEVRWHFLQILPRLMLTPAERGQAFEVAADSLDHDSRIVVADALSAMFKLSIGDAVLEERAKYHATLLLSSPSAAVRTRAKKLLVAGR
ncbi:MAG: hypothetical protein IR164_14220 [Devosia sp.]|uniref:hypothetical protein n=1 Tax=Devosia sp. TaxID=1871048 RepID=UPI0019E964A4|nr:hypothetical protein [Devosia sp.]MBF0680085.1 hypothetical protein [Devosia sp.]